MAKPSYAAVAAAEPTKQAATSGSAEQGDAPPPYSGPSQPSTRPPLPPTHIESQPIPHPDGWSPPPNMQVAKSRAVRRFWLAFFWAWVIYIAVAVLLGGGISDARHAPIGRHGHWDKHGRWRSDDRIPQIDQNYGGSMSYDLPQDNSWACNWISWCGE